jgi:phage terminase Nu1 subunit (DNA packaging protein)
VSRPRRDAAPLPAGHLTVEQAAKVAGRSVRTIKRWMAEGMPARTESGRTVVAEVDVKAWVQRKDPERVERLSDWV